MNKPLLLYVGTGALVTPRGCREDDFFANKRAISHAFGVFRSIARIGVVLLPTNQWEVFEHGMPSCIFLDQPVLCEGLKMIQRFAEWGIDAPIVWSVSSHEEVRFVSGHMEANSRAGKSLPLVSPVCTGEHQCLWVRALLHHAA